MDQRSKYDPARQPNQKWISPTFTFFRAKQMQSAFTSASPTASRIASAVITRARSRTPPNFGPGGSRRRSRSRIELGHQNLNAISKRPAGRVAHQAHNRLTGRGVQFKADLMVVEMIPATGLKRLVYNNT